MKKLLLLFSAFLLTTSTAFAQQQIYWTEVALEVCTSAVLKRQGLDNFAFDSLIDLWNISRCRGFFDIISTGNHSP